MSKRINIPALFMVITLLLCEFNFTVIDDSYSFVSDTLSDSGAVQEQSISPIADASFVDFCTLESISSSRSASLLTIRSQTKGKGLQRSIVRILLLFASILFLFKIAFRSFNGWLYPPENAVTSSLILCFIHNKDGKK